MRKYDNLGQSSYQSETCWAAELRRNKVLIVLCRCSDLKVSLIRLKSHREHNGKPFCSKTLLWAKAVLAQSFLAVYLRFWIREREKRQTCWPCKRWSNHVSDGRAKQHLCRTRRECSVEVLVAALSKIKVSAQWRSHQGRFPLGFCLVLSGFSLFHLRSKNARERPSPLTLNVTLGSSFRLTLVTTLPVSSSTSKMLPLYGERSRSTL